MERRQRWMIIPLVVVVLAATGVITAAVWPARDRIRTVSPAGLDVAAAATGQWQVGSVQVVLESDRLTLRRHGRVVWQSPQQRAFLTAGRGRVGWHEHRGYFWPRVSYADRLDRQSVDRVERTDTKIIITGRLRGDGDPAQYRFTVSEGADNGATLDIEADDVTSVALVSGRTSGAGVHGFGEQFAEFDLSGRLLPIVVREQGVGRGLQPLTALANAARHGTGGNDQMTYAAWPSYVTDDLRGARLDPDARASNAFAVADLRDPDRVALEVWSSTISVAVTAADTPAELIAAQQSAADRPGVPGWATDGAIVGLQGGTAAVRRKVDTLLEAGADISGVWIQDWAGSRRTSFGDRLWWTWQHDRSRYPGWARLVSDLRQQSIRTTTYVNPSVVDAAAKTDAQITNLAAEARRRGFLVRDPDGGPYRVDQGGFDAFLIDLTNPQARSWFAQVIADHVLADGVEGFMADFGENLPYDAVLHNGTPATLHNRWPLLWAQTVADACRRADKPECLTWFRAGALGQSEVSPLFWNGDQLVDFGSDDGLASALFGSFSAGVSGWPLVHSDVGGYTAVDTPLRNYRRSEELLARWAEYQAFGVLLRTHEGNRPADNTQVYDSTATASTFARMTRLYAALAPYRREVVAEAVRTGVPAIRHGWLVVPGTAAAEVDTQFFLGDRLLMAPVLEDGADRVAVTLPPGQWTHLITGREYAGGRTVTVPAPIGTPAAFLRSGDPWLDRLQPRVRAALD